MTIAVRAPATSANIGSGFDVAGAALALWNELVVRDEPGVLDESHLGVRAFSVYASPSGRTFEWTSDIPRERGLGSSAAVVALGLVAGAVAAGVSPSVEELYSAGLELEGHGDNLAAALAGGVCLTCDGTIHRVADSPPAVAVAVIPETRVSTAASRAALPDSVPRADAVFDVGRASLLGAALASGDEAMFAAALDDRLHEPYRVASAPHLTELRRDLPAGALGATLSGSGPTVIVWSRAGEHDRVAAAVAERFPEHRVAALEASPEGAAASARSS
ncbi:MAG TPA: homoserine kinase [Gaiellaceae bacterium]|nr:homoserine kinase [Gaiellaceae bacterium]